MLDRLAGESCAAAQDLRNCLVSYDFVCCKVPFRDNWEKRRQREEEGKGALMKWKLNRVWQVQSCIFSDCRMSSAEFMTATYRLYIAQAIHPQPPPPHTIIDPINRALNSNCFQFRRNLLWNCVTKLFQALILCNLSLILQAFRFRTNSEC